MQEKKPAFEIIDKRGANKEPVVREVPAVVTEPTGDITAFKSMGYMFRITEYPRIGQMPVCRGVGLRGDGLVAVVDWILSAIMVEGADPVKYVKDRLNTFLGCECVQRRMCAQHDRYMQQWIQADLDRLNLMGSTPLCEALEVYMRAEQAQQKAQVMAPRR